MYIDCFGLFDFKKKSDFCIVLVSILISRAMVDGDILVENVPFSCCDSKILRPCVTADVMNFNSRKSYKAVTLYKKGCSALLADEFENRILQPVGMFVMALFFVQVC